MVAGSSTQAAFSTSHAEFPERLQREQLQAEKAGRKGHDAGTPTHQIAGVDLLRGGILRSSHRRPATTSRGALIAVVMFIGGDEALRDVHRVGPVHARDVDHAAGPAVRDGFGLGEEVERVLVREDVAVEGFTAALEVGSRVGIGRDATARPERPLVGVQFPRIIGVVVGTELGRIRPAHDDSGDLEVGTMGRV